MAPNSSSVFNEAPAETKPSSTTSAPTEPTLITPQPSTSSTSMDPRAVTTSSSVVTTASSSSSEAKKQVAPKMEPAVDERTSMYERTESPLGMRFARVSPVGLDESKTTLTFRKSCLKRSNSALPASLNTAPISPVVVKAPEAITVEKETTPAYPVQKNKRRCWECKAKVPLTAVTCRCDYTFCNKHRYAEEHNCRFNFKTAGKRKLEEENPRVVPAKVARIN
ncbi:hypothetical protein Poli38472_008207 [Pythium oligandrum]|uniref:AN1-type domain-containing protein n=1 Tax=Pythium oligandrum TaxID=41045 RepID=A0A8K1FJ06_PYTOL|nr:hypothetical protein Poli38472_008207 [Pythium oligandrum]|eukprot:TMW65565.1 hypothetical protein Poli38472_008207 [Pythium oligandrum]